MNTSRSRWVAKRSVRTSSTKSTTFSVNAIIHACFESLFTAASTSGQASRSSTAVTAATGDSGAGIVSIGLVGGAEDAAGAGDDAGAGALGAEVGAGKSTGLIVGLVFFGTSTTGSGSAATWAAADGEDVDWAAGALEAAGAAEVGALPTPMRRSRRSRRACEPISVRSAEGTKTLAHMSSRCSFGLVAPLISLSPWATMLAAWVSSAMPKRFACNCILSSSAGDVPRSTARASSPTERTTIRSRRYSSRSSTNRSGS